MRAVALVSVLCGAAVLIALTPSAEGTSIVHQRRHATKAQQALEAGADAAVMNPFTKPDPSWCRAPCPALNTLANHGYLNQKGVDITKDELYNALVNVIGLSPLFGGIFTNAAMSKFANPATQKLSLCDTLTNMHTNGLNTGKTGVEHAASLSREDRPLTNGQLDFSAHTDQTQRNPAPVQSNILLSHVDPKNPNYISVSSFVAAREAIVAKSYHNEPALQADSADGQMKVIAAVEGCLLLSALAGNTNGGGFQIRTDYAKSFLQGEQFPTGWAKSANAIGIPEVLSCVAQQGFAWAANTAIAELELAKHWFFATVL